MTNKIDIVLWVWFVLTALSVFYVAYDLYTNTPAMKVMKWGWILVTLYTGVVGFAVYWFSCREPAPGTHEKFIAPLWKQTVGSTIHCLAGDATGIIVAAAVTALLGFPMGIDAVLEYVAGFAFGLFVFQALFMKDMLGVSYWEAVKTTFLPEWLSMNAVMAGMIPVMIILMTRDMQAMEPTSVRFWGIMSLASLVGVGLAFPVNYWLVKNKLKHGMGTERVLGKGGTEVEFEQARLEGIKQYSSPNKNGAMKMPEMRHTTGKHKTAGEKQGKESGKAAMSEMKMGDAVSTAKKGFVTLLTILMLAAGVFIAGRYGDFSMKAGEPMINPMPEGEQMNRMRH